jgi:hypothetical protein
MQKKIIWIHLQLQLQHQKALIQRQGQFAVNSVGTLVLAFNRILSTSDCAKVFIMPISPPNRPQMYLF